MMDQLVALIVDEGKWLTASMACAALAVAVRLYRWQRSGLSTRRVTLAAMNLFFGVTIGTMAFGHLLAVTTKLLVGTLEGSVAAFYALGVALAVPSWWLVVHALRMPAAAVDPGRATLGLNGWLAGTLLALGIHNLPLALPGFLNVGYQLQTRRRLGWAIVGVAVLANGGLFVASLILAASGQSFEQFRGMP